MSPLPDITYGRTNTRKPVDIRATIAEVVEGTPGTATEFAINGQYDIEKNFEQDDYELPVDGALTMATAVEKRRDTLQIQGIQEIPFGTNDAAGALDALVEKEGTVTVEVEVWALAQGETAASVSEHVKKFQGTLLPQSRSYVRGERRELNLHISKPGVIKTGQGGDFSGV